MQEMTMMAVVMMEEVGNTSRGAQEACRNVHCVVMHGRGLLALEKEP